jgi:dipeptidyl aminopeptidase/acylaminoacyl peptidase
MRIGWFIASVLASFCFASAQAAPLEAYGQLPSLEDVSLSPDGKNLSFVTNVGNKRTVIVKSVADHTTLAAIAAGDRKLRALTWADSDHLLITTSSTRTAVGFLGPKQELYTVQSYSLSTHKFYTLLDDQKQNAMNVVFSQPEVHVVDGKKKVFVQGVSFPADRGVRTLFSVDLDEGVSKAIRYGDPHVQGWLLDSQGEAVAQAMYDEDTKRWSLQLRNRGGWYEAYGVVAPIETPQIYTYGPSGDLVVIAEIENGRDVYKQIDVATGKWGPPLDLGQGVGGLMIDPATQRIIGTNREGEFIEHTFFDHADQLAWNSIVHAFAGENVSIVGWSDDRRRIVVEVVGARDGAMYELVDLDAHSADAVGPLYRGVGPADRAEVKYISYKAADGREIPAYLTLPNGKPPKDLPLIVLPHGGPAARDEPGFDWWSQALASRGYAVLQPEFRGSDGFGWDHLAAGFGEWGRKMQSDLSDGVRYLTAQGLVDAKRVCIVGASYGGYAALAGATMDRGVYRCAVSVAGVSDPRTMLDWDKHLENASDSQGQRYMKRFMGVAALDDPKLDEIAPVSHVTKDTVPILLIHGRDDTVVYFDQSSRMEAALKAAGKPVTFVTLDGEDHWLSRAETRLQMLQATVSFLEANDPPN